MAFSMPSPSASGRRRGTAPLAEINIIPLVDVVLVLLIIFMLTAHVMEYGLEVDVPKVVTSNNSAQDLPVVTMSADGRLILNEKPVANVHNLAAEIHGRFPSQQQIYVRADKAVTWDALAQVVAILGQGKFAVRMVTQPADAGSGNNRK